MRYQEGNISAFLLMLFFSAGSLLAQSTADVPAYRGHVNDFAGVLEPSKVAEIETKLKIYEDSTSTQIAVVTEKSLNGADVFDRAMAFARSWGVGSKEKNNGVVLYLAIEDRKYHTVTSQATQGKLTDGVVGRIQREFLVPNLRSGDYGSAVDQTVTAYMQALDGEFKNGKGVENVPGISLFTIIIILIIIILIINNRGRGRGMRSSGVYWFPTGGWNSGGGGWGSNSRGGGWGGFGGGGGFDGGGAGGSW